jgi:hypothetical protein
LSITGGALSPNNATAAENDREVRTQRFVFSMVVTLVVTRAGAGATESEADRQSDGPFIQTYMTVAMMPRPTGPKSKETDELRS